LKDQTLNGVDDERIREYLAGRLDAAEAERFEERMFADDELAAEVQRALEIRAAMSPAAAKRRTGRPRPRTLFAFAAAAAAAMVAVGVLWLQPQQPPVFRGVEQRMSVEIDEVGDGFWLANWQPVAGAADYELQVLASDGGVLLTIHEDGLAAGFGHDSAAFIEVSALDELGQTLRRSERLALPDR
jgi:hypothetical protein